MGIRIVNPNIGYRSSSARTIIRKYDYTWYNWKSGNTKPEKMLFGYKVKIVYWSIYGSDIIDEKTFQNRDTAKIYLSSAITNLICNGYAIISSTIQLVRL